MRKSGGGYCILIVACSVSCFQIACVACVKRGRGRGNLGARIPPSPSPFNAGHAGYFQIVGDEATILKPTPPICLALTASLRRAKVANLVLRVFSLIKKAAASTVVGSVSAVSRVRSLMSASSFSRTAAVIRADHCLPYGPEKEEKTWGRGLVGSMSHPSKEG